MQCAYALPLLLLHQANATPASVLLLYHVPISLQVHPQFPRSHYAAVHCSIPWREGEPEDSGCCYS